MVLCNNRKNNQTWGKYYIRLFYIFPNLMKFYQTLSIQNCSSVTKTRSQERNSLPVDGKLQRERTIDLSIKIHVRLNKLDCFDQSYFWKFYIKWTIFLDFCVINICSLWNLMFIWLVYITDYCGQNAYCSKAKKLIEFLLNLKNLEKINF